VRATDARIVSSSSGRRVDHLGLDALDREGVGGGTRARQHAAIGDQADVSTRPPDGRAIEVDGPRVLGKARLLVLQTRVFEDQHRIRVREGGGEHAARIFDGGRGDDADPGNVRHPALETVGVLGRQLEPGAGGHADHEGDVELAVGHVEQGRRVVQDLVEGEQAEVHGHDLDDRPQTAQRRADSRPDEARFRERCIPDPLGAELGEQTAADAVGAAIGADVLAHQEDAIVRQ
jgi:hypothetical protein